MTQRTRWFKQQGDRWYLWRKPESTDGYDWQVKGTRTTNNWYPAPDGVPTADELRKIAVLRLAHSGWETTTIPGVGEISPSGYLEVEGWTLRSWNCLSNTGT